MSADAFGIVVLLLVISILLSLYTGLGLWYWRGVRQRDRQRRWELMERHWDARMRENQERRRRE